jgi:hypothetical protein
MFRGVKRGFETMEHAVEPLIDRAAGDVEMGMRAFDDMVGLPVMEELDEVGTSALGELAAAEEIAEVAAMGAEAFNPIALAGMAAFEIGRRVLGKKRKRDSQSVISPRAPSRPPGVQRPSNMPKKSAKSKKRSAKRAKTVMKKRPSQKKVSAKKGPKKKKKVSYSVTIKQEVHGKMRRKNVSYFGFQATAGAHELFRVASDAVLRAVLRKYNVTIRRTDEVVPVLTSVPAMAKMQIFYRRTKYDDGTEGSFAHGAIINMTAGTFESHVTAVADEFETQVRGGYYPVLVRIKNNAGTDIGQLYSIGDAQLNLSVKRTIKMRNITKNDDNGDTLTSLDTNPLQGRLYKFRHDTPRINATIYETDPATLSKFHDRYCTAGVIFGPQRNAADDHDGVPVTPVIMTEDKLLSSPPPGGRVWDNLSSSKKIGMAPGQAAMHKMAFKYSGTIRQFLDKFAATAYTPPSIGYCHVFGFEQKFKTDANDEVNVEYDCDDVLKGGCTLKREDVTPPTVISHHAHNSAYV